MKGQERVKNNKKNRKWFPSIPSITNGNLGKRDQEKRKTYKRKHYKKFPPTLKSLRSETEKGSEIHNTIRVVIETFQMAEGRPGSPTSSQSVGEKSHKQRSNSQKGMSFLNSNPETRRLTEK